jgi:hypothetical protein
MDWYPAARAASDAVPAKARPIMAEIVKDWVIGKVHDRVEKHTKELDFK